VTNARAVIEALGLIRHPEGGWYTETWRAGDGDGEGDGDGRGDGGGADSRPTASAILYLLAAGERSHWHRVDADEIWQYSAGEPLELRTWTEGEASIAVHRLGGDVTAGSVVQAVVPAGAWQAARPLGSWTLVGCIVSPAFSFAGFELAPVGWEPPVNRRSGGGRDPIDA
jgi:predicted cupin superfamily sugar epimerase